MEVNNEQRASVLVTEDLVSEQSYPSDKVENPPPPPPPPPLQKSEFDQFWAAHKDRPLEGRNSIVASLCPQVFGLYIVKLSVCLALIGGVEVGVACRSCDYHVTICSSSMWMSLVPESEESRIYC